MRITAMGDTLSILINSEYSLHHDWMSFAAWYSVYKNLPDAEVAVLCARDLGEGYTAYNWPFRSGVKFFQYENVGKRFDYPPLNKLYAIFTALKENIVHQPLLVIDSYTMCLRQLTKDVVDKLNESELHFGASGETWFFNNQPLESFVEVLNHFRVKRSSLPMLRAVMGEPEFLPGLCSDCKNPDLPAFAHYFERCGRFNRKAWMDEKRAAPFPFSSQFNNVDTSANEKKILSLWSQMHGAYEAMR